MSDLVCVRDFFDLFDLFFLKYNGVRFFSSIIRHDRFFVSVGFFLVRYFLARIFFPLKSLCRIFFF